MREGKGKRDRVVPIGERAIMWVNRYVHEVRPQLVMPPETVIELHAALDAEADEEAAARG